MRRKKQLILENETIAAIATPLGTGGVGIVRCSGSGVSSLIATLFSLPHLKSHYVHYAALKDPDNGALVDEWCVIYFKSPRSYTGEDVVEIQCHGGYYNVQKILSLVCEHGCRLAAKGEFTRRAFLNGKMDLMQAESVIDMIHATSDKAHAVAMGHHQGGLYNYIQPIRKQLIDWLEVIQASIDFPDEVEGLDHADMRVGLESILSDLQKILSYQDFGEFVQQGVRCVIVGRPNVGKSSLINRLIGEERSIVTDMPGTTRDYIDVSMKLGGLNFRLFDTAGIRESSDAIEQLGIQKVDALIQKADIIFWVLDMSEALTDDDRLIRDRISNNDRVYILENKQDLPCDCNCSDLALLEHWPRFQLSTKTGRGISLLKEALYTEFVQHNEHVPIDMLCNVRQQDCLKRSLSRLGQLRENMTMGYEDDMLSIDIRAALLPLGELTGDAFTEELLDSIFSRFCIGK